MILDGEHDQAPCWVVFDVQASFVKLFGLGDGLTQRCLRDDEPLARFGWAVMK